MIFAFLVKLGAVCLSLEGPRHFSESVPGVNKPSKSQASPLQLFLCPTRVFIAHEEYKRRQPLGPDSSCLLSP